MRNAVRFSLGALATLGKLPTPTRPPPITSPHPPKRPQRKWLRAGSC